MNQRKLDRLNRKLAAAYDGRVSASLNAENRSIVVSGSLDSWEELVSACTMCVYNKNGWHVVNHVDCKEASHKQMHMPSIEDKAIDGMKPDVLVIGGGICGAAIARELTRYKLDVLLVEKESDLAMQASSRNDGEVHPGIDQKHLTLKLQYELRGNEMYPEVCRELGVKFRRVGQYVAFKGNWTKPLMEVLALQRYTLGVKDTEVLSREELYKAQPNLNEGYDIALYSPRAGIVCPYGLTIAYAENAVQNGAKVSLNTAVTGFEFASGGDAGEPHIISAVHTNRGTVYPLLVVNAAGIFSDKIAELAGDEFFSLHPRRGTEAVIDNKKADSLTDAIVSYRDLIVKGEKHTKGGGILRTVDDNILIGPDAVETPDREDYSTHPESIEWLFNKQRKTVETLNERDIITYFTGVRAATFEEDFIVESGRRTRNLIHCAGIQSPGLTAAPALAVDISKMAAEMLGITESNPSFDPIRKPIPRLCEMEPTEREAYIHKNPDYGVIVCRCEEISKGEIIDALKSSICVPTIDGIKRRVRPGMGRCQGGFCGPQLSKIIADFMGCELSEVTKKGNGSKVTLGKLK